MKNIFMIPIVLITVMMSQPYGFTQEVRFDSNTIMIGMVVSDLQASMKFYMDIIGMEHIEKSDFSVEESFAKQSGLTDGTPFQVKVLQLGKVRNPTRLKLMSFGQQVKKQTNQYITNQTGIQYITIYVKDLTPILARMEKATIQPLGETPIPLNDKKHFILLQDPDGTFVELIGVWKGNQVNTASKKKARRGVFNSNYNTPPREKWLDLDDIIK